MKTWAKNYNGELINLTLYHVINIREYEDDSHVMWFEVRAILYYNDANRYDILREFNTKKDADEYISSLYENKEEIVCHMLS